MTGLVSVELRPGFLKRWSQDQWRLHAQAKIEVQFHRIAFASAQFSIGSIATLATLSAG
jgi:hypothetical protein